jgi:restriction system protein
MQDDGRTRSGLMGVQWWLEQLDRDDNALDDDGAFVVGIGENARVVPGYMLPALSGNVNVTLGDVTLRAEATVQSANDELVVGMGIVKLGERVDEGELVEAVTIPWKTLARALASNPDLLYQFEPRKFEELVAAAYHEDGYEVTLTPRSGDGGKDVIATRRGRFSVRFLDQMKRYKPGSVVTADEVRAMYGVLTKDSLASKAYITTTANFAPGVKKEFATEIPTRLDLRNGAELRDWIVDLARRRG